MNVCGVTHHADGIPKITSAGRRPGGVGGPRACLLAQALISWQKRRGLTGLGPMSGNRYHTMDDQDEVVQ